MKTYYMTPGGEYLNLYADAAKQAHLLIAGQSGSGKSVVENGIIHYLLLQSPAAAQLILIDPKRVELIDYRSFPHVIKYASEPADMIRALEMAMRIIDQRYNDMQRRHVKKHSGSNIYVIIDELADLMTTNAKQAEPLLTRIGQIGRAANVHLLVCTQHLLSAIIPTSIKCNLSAVIGLRTRNRRDSYMLIDQAGCETLTPGRAIYLRPGHDPEPARIPYHGEDATQAETERLLKHWKDPRNTWTE